MRRLIHLLEIQMGSTNDCITARAPIGGGSARLVGPRALPLGCSRGDEHSGSRMRRWSQETSPARRHRPANGRVSAGRPRPNGTLTAQPAGRSAGAGSQGPGARPRVTCGHRSALGARGRDTQRLLQAGSACRVRGPTSGGDDIARTLPGNTGPDRAGATRAHVSSSEGTAGRPLVTYSAPPTCIIRIVRSLWTLRARASDGRSTGFNV